MKRIEKAPGWKDLNLLSAGAILLLEGKHQETINKINDKYLYWDKVKYAKTDKKTNPKELWSAVKFTRTLGAKRLSFGKHQFQYNLTNNIEKTLHEFDLNIGGQLSADGIISKHDKEKYLVNSIMEEAISSSQIEGAVTTRKKAKEMLRKNKKPKTKSEQMILNNYNTIKHIVDNKTQPLTHETLFEIHKSITHKTFDDPNNEGRYRVNNDVNVVDAVDGEIVYSPLNYKEIGKLMDELFDFFNKEDEQNFVHPIIKACVIHFMIGFIHPFVDGNGRTARTLFYWYMLKNGYWLTEYLSISRLIVESKTQYALAYQYSEIDDNDITYFIKYKLKTMQLAYESLREYIKRKIDEKKQSLNFQKIEGINERQATILKWINEKPNILLTIKEIETRFAISNQTSRTDLYDLSDKGYLELIERDKKTKAFCKSQNFEIILQKAYSNML